MKQVLIAIDQLAHTLIGGMADKTLSARLWRTQHPLHRWVDKLFFWDRQGPAKHCELSHRAELLRQHQPVGYRQNTEGVQR